MQSGPVVIQQHAGLKLASLFVTGFGEMQKCHEVISVSPCPIWPYAKNSLENLGMTCTAAFTYV